MNTIPKLLQVCLEVVGTLSKSPLLAPQAPALIAVLLPVPSVTSESLSQETEQGAWIPKGRTLILNEEVSKTRKR